VGGRFEDFSFQVSSRRGSDDPLQVRPEFLFTNVGPLPSAGAFSSPPEGRRPKSMTGLKLNRAYDIPLQASTKAGNPQPVHRASVAEQKSSEICSRPC